MASWISNRYNNVVSATKSYLNSEADGDTEDDTHVCRVLRRHYTEKGKPFPGWLPPDPKAPPPVTAVYAQPSQVGSRYGGLGQQPQQGGSLSSLWDNNPAPQAQETQSLRRGRGAATAMRNSDGRDSPFRNSDPMAGNGRDDTQARPLPSQRAGSHQPQGGLSSAPTPTGSGGGSAQDRLKQRLFGGARTTSPSSTGPFNPPPQRGGGGGGSGDYEDRFAPGGMYDGRSSRGGNGGDKPHMGANSPWSNNESDYSSSGGGGRPGGRRPVGLPSGPRMR